MIYVTHDQVEAMTMGDRIVVMRDGLIQQIGTPLGLYNQPVNRFVAGFIGSPPMNIVNARVVTSGGQMVIDEGDFQIQIDGDMADSLRSHVDKDVLFGIRPEDLLYDESPAARNNIKARVEVVEPLGAEIHLYVSTAKNQIIARVPPRHDFQVGEEVNLHPDVTKLHVFDMESEAAVAQPTGART